MADSITKVDLKWQLGFAPHYQFDKMGNCYNVKSGIPIKRTLGENTQNRYTVLV